MTTIRRNTVERKIYFYRADIGNDESGTPLPFDPLPALNEIEILPFVEGVGGRYEPELDGDLSCLFRESGYTNTALRFCRVRRNGLPQLERAGEISELFIPVDTGLLEPIHVVFFSRNVVGIEYNHFGPRPSRLSAYLYNKSNQAIPAVRFEPLLYRDIAEQLNNLTDLRLFTFRVRSSYAATVRNIDNSLADAIEASAALLNSPPEAEIIVRIPRDERESALERFLDPVRGTTAKG